MFRLTLNRVRDHITIREGDETLSLAVDCDARMLVSRIRKAQIQLTEANKSESTDEDRQNAARAFSVAIFGEGQTDKLAEFYGWDYSCVMTISGLYFEKRLCKKIIAAQKKQK